MNLKMLSSMIILTVVLHTSLCQRDPCTVGENQNAYDTFLNQHLNKNAPNEKKKKEWNDFINKIGTWDRPTQSFFPFSEASRVIAVCSSGGKMFRGNLCISKNPLKFFTIEVNDKKQVMDVTVKQQHVILGCDKIENRCLPVHFEANRNNDKPDNNRKDCS